MTVTGGEVLANHEVAPRYFVMRLRAPALARTAQPGQFIQIRCSQSDAHPLLPRPFSVMRADPNEEAIDILYRVQGAGTYLLSRAAVGETLTLWGPLGNGFSSEYVASDGSCGQHIVVGGGVGIPPLLLLVAARLQSAEWAVTDVRVLLGARTAGEVLCANDFQSFGMGINVATDDGSWGHHGVITHVLQYELATSMAMSGSENIRVYACGPHAMLRAAARVCATAGVACQVCMEAPMPCGIGVCMGCVIPMRSAEGGVKYRRCCREGPVFDAREVVWE